MVDKRSQQEGSNRCEGQSGKQSLSIHRSNLLINPNHHFHRVARKHRTVATAAATPNGSFSKPGLSSVISGKFRRPKERKPWTNTNTLMKVSFTRLARMMITMAMIPDTKM